MNNEDYKDSINNDNKDIEIITGDGKNLDISRVYDHIKMDNRPEKKNKEGIVIPESKTKREDKKEDDSES